MTSRLFNYVALGATGQRVKGALEATSADAAHALLAQQGLAALRLDAAADRSAPRSRIGVRLSRAATAEFLHDLGALAQAGVNLRSALLVLAQPQAAKTPSSRIAGLLEAEIAAGVGLDVAFLRVLGDEAHAVSGLVAAGEASGNLGEVLRRGAEDLENEIEASDAVLAAISYPAFVLLMSVASVLVILTVVVPSLAPLVEQSHSKLPPALSALFFISGILRGNWPLLCALAAGVGVGGIIGWRSGLIRRPFELWLLDGPAASIVRGLVFGGVIRVFGALMAARVPASEALALACRTASLQVVRDRVAGCIAFIREGASVSSALASCKGMPQSALRLAAVGEEVGRLGPMLQRAGSMERRRALRGIKALSQWLGPLLIVVLGAVIGLVMASLLGGITALGDAASGPSS